MNFRQRIIATFLVFALALTTVFGVLLDNVMNFIEDQIIRDFLIENMVFFEQQLAQDGQLINTPKLQSYLSGRDTLPGFLQELEDGFHDTESVHVFVKTLNHPDHAGQHLILVFDESQAFLDTHENSIFIAMLIFSCVIVCLAAVVCVYLAKSIASPIEYLANTVSSEHGDITHSPMLKRQDELGSLARAFDASVQEIQVLLEREKNFTRYASHELRTPLTVVRNNIDLLRFVTEKKMAEAKTSNIKVTQTYDNSVLRLYQAIWFMEQQINTMLLLARGEYKPQFTRVNLAVTLDEVAIYFPNLELDFAFDNTLNLHLDRTVLLSVLTNVLNNVVEHGANDNGVSKAKILADESGLSIINSMVSRREDYSGKRFGLEIVSQLCDVMEWGVEFEEAEIEEPYLFSVTIKFALKENI